MKEPTGVRRRHKFRKTPTSSYPTVPPRIPAVIDTLFLSLDSGIVARKTSAFEEQIVTTQTVYKPGLLALARVTFRGTRWQIHVQREVAKVILYPKISQIPVWEENLVERWNNKNTRSAGEPHCFYIVDDSYDFSAEKFEALQQDFIDFLIRSETLQLSYNAYLKILRGSDESEESFFDRCQEQVRQGFDQEMRTLDESTVMQQERLRERLEREVREKSENEMEAETRMGKDPAVRSMKEQIASLEGTRETKRKEFEEKISDLSRQQEQDLVRLHRSDVEVVRLALVWLPYTEFIIQENDARRLELIQSF